MVDKENKNDEVEIIEEDEDRIITLEDDEGNEIEYILIAEFPYKEGYYFLMQPKILPEDMEEDEAIAFEVIDLSDDEEDYELREIEDEEEENEIFEEYYRLLETIK